MTDFNTPDGSPNESPGWPPSPPISGAVTPPPAGSPLPPPPMAPQQPPAGSPLPPPPGAPAAYDAGYGYGQQPYHPYGQQVVMATNPFDEKATTILVLGILGLVVCQLLGVAAWVMGNNLKKEAESAGYPEPEKGKIGRILGMISAGLLALGLVFMVFWFVFVVILAGTSSP